MMTPQECGESGWDRWATATIQLQEALVRIDSLEKLAEARGRALRQYAGHHSSCEGCYRVWDVVKDALDGR